MILLKRSSENDTRVDSPAILVSQSHRQLQSTVKYVVNEEPRTSQKRPRSFGEPDLPFQAWKGGAVGSVPHMGVAEPPLSRHYIDRDKALCYVLSIFEIESCCSDGTMERTMVLFGSARFVGLIAI